MIGSCARGNSGGAGFDFLDDPIKWPDVGPSVINSLPKWPEHIRGIKFSDNNAIPDLDKYKK